MGEDAPHCRGDGNAASRLLGGFFRPRPAANGKIFVVNSDGTLFELDIDNLRTTEIWDGLPGNGRFGWAVEDGAVLLLTGSETGGDTRLIRFDLDANTRELLHAGSMPLADMNLAIGRNSGAILLTQFQSSSDDIVMYENVAIR